MNTQNLAAPVYDAIVIGAGFAGLYQLHLLRQQGLKVCVLEAGDEVGGTWYWNCYPGARTDSPSNIYQYWFSDALLDEWNWQERYAPQEETKRYLNHVADRFELRKDIHLGQRVTAAHWNESAKAWDLETRTGERYRTQFLITCLGPLSEPVMPRFTGQEQFKGRVIHSARWPREGIDLRGKRVGVVGTGATGIQIIQAVAPEASQLTVFQRTANYAVPMKNRKLTDADRAEVRAQQPMTREKVWTTFSGFEVDLEERNFLDLSPEERRRTLEHWWAEGTLKIWIGGFKEIFFDPVVSEEVSDFVREKMRARIRDPKVAEKLIPRDHGFGTRRVPLENGYFEIYNRDNVTLVDLNEGAIVGLTANGVETADGREHPLDVLILATGFDAGTGGLTSIDIRGRSGESLKEAWARDIRTTMGLQIHGYPNLLTSSAPFAPAASLCNAPTCLQQQVQWIADCIAFTRSKGARTIEPTEETERKWIAHHDELASVTLLAKTRSWYTGANVEGKQLRLLSYVGGVGAYGKLCDEVKSKDYEGFELA
ncbi:MAG: NAD(P)/FAD-dependent oxidoreductase [Nevskia sp.]